ncbi:hypothetical protein NECAME_17189 [Necator americanus]|uniref:Uncharacterized protein n=1 Tax=Necator americanus TaxID=51031 RepID=W2TRG6_NECAM|nr:hypothetical protein NECAME_17189 [Necator americanus]ETN84249.1 hypothetical protein NECAME_17189 [Necator americanus]
MMNIQVWTFQRRIREAVGKVLFLRDIGSPRGYRTNGKERQDGNDMVLKEFEATIQKKKYGYYVRLPWKKDSADLPDNKAMSFRRLQTIVAKLQKNPELMQQYHNTFMNQL